MYRVFPYETSVSYILNLAKLTLSKIYAEQRILFLQIFVLVLFKPLFFFSFFPCVWTFLNTFCTYLCGFIFDVCIVFAFFLMCNSYMWRYCFLQNVIISHLSTCSTQFKKKHIQFLQICSYFFNVSFYLFNAISTDLHHNSTAPVKNITVSYLHIIIDIQYDPASYKKTCVKNMRTGI